ncbi:ABC transporter permease [Microbacterium sp. MPKO10]|uniref:ABC transporter permease n=1 Tax=Microbacterium sp. MPKO10 TaxID=2989818 RepID=UPI002235EC78|nr:ABC transporter permease [Microbacterium sp. MPKO10]MCW4458809.1 ABC transporter permease [Microbacterium sp. MPKO10]
MSVISARDLIRNPQTGFALLFMFGFYLLVIVAIEASFTMNRPEPVVAVVAVPGAEASSFLDILENNGIDASMSESERPLTGGVNAVVTMNADKASVILEAEKSPGWQDIWHSLRVSGYMGSEITVVDTVGDHKTDFLRHNLGTALALGFMAIAFIGTAVPLVSMRERGILRLFGTTPLPRASLLASQLPIKMVLGLAEAALVIGIALSLNYVDAIHTGRLFLTMLLSLTMLLAFGLLFATRSRSAEATQQTMAMLPILLIAPAGGVFPLDDLPTFLIVICNMFPTTWVVAAISADIADIEAFTSLPILWLLMLAVSAVVFFVASRRFQWDQGDIR